MVFSVKANVEMVTLWEIAAQEMLWLQRSELSPVCREPDVSADQEAFNLPGLVLEHLCTSPSPNGARGRKSHCGAKGRREENEPCLAPAGMLFPTLCGVSYVPSLSVP